MKPRPSIRQLHYFVTIAETEHFGKAAELCRMSQPALSMAIKDLEDILQNKIFERRNSKIFLTNLGKTMLPYAKRILRETDDLMTLADTKGYSEPIHFGVIPTIAPFIWPGILPEIRSSHTSTSLYLTESKTDTLVEALDDGSIDLILISETLGKEFHSEILYEEPFVFAAHEKNTLLEKTSIDPKEIPQKDLLLLDDGHCMRDQALNLCKTVSKYDETLSASSILTLIHMINGENGVTLLPKTATYSHILQGTSIKTKPLNYGTRPIVLCWRKYDSREKIFESISTIIKNWYLSTENETL